MPRPATEEHAVCLRDAACLEIAAAAKSARAGSWFRSASRIGRRDDEGREEEDLTAGSLRSLHSGKVPRGTKLQRKIQALMCMIAKTKVAHAIRNAMMESAQDNFLFKA
jgi:hypothetical protein